MSRLQSELQRLYGAHSPAGADRAAAANGQVQAVVLELARPADWTVLSTLWRGVQADLNLPAPAIAVNGIDGFQLWFSLPAPMSAAQARAFVDALRLRYLRDIPNDRLSITSALDAMPPQPTLEGQWSSFVAADLAPVFADEPWLDLPPGEDGQADVLCRLERIKSADFRVALERLVIADTASPVSIALKADSAGLDPERFLRQVLNDESVALGLRIEAAKALLPRSG